MNWLPECPKPDCFTQTDDEIRMEFASPHSFFGYLGLVTVIGMFTIGYSFIVYWGFRDQSLFFGLFVSLALLIAFCFVFPMLFIESLGRHSIVLDKTGLRRSCWLFWERQAEIVIPMSELMGIVCQKWDANKYYYKIYAFRMNDSPLLIHPHFWTTEPFTEFSTAANRFIDRFQPESSKIRQAYSAFLSANSAEANTEAAPLVPLSWELSALRSEEPAVKAPFDAMRIKSRPSGERVWSETPRLSLASFLLFLLRTLAVCVFLILLLLSTINFSVSAESLREAFWIAYGDTPVPYILPGLLIGGWLFYAWLDSDFQLFFRRTWKTAHSILTYRKTFCGIPVCSDQTIDLTRGVRFAVFSDRLVGFCRAWTLQLQDSTGNVLGAFSGLTLDQARWLALQFAQSTE